MIKGRTAAITAVGAYVPDQVLSNTDLEQIVDTSDEWIRSRTGISERRILKDKPTSFMAIQAAKNLIERSSIDPKTIDLVLVSTSTPDILIAATAALWQLKLAQQLLLVMTYKRLALAFFMGCPLLLLMSALAAISVCC